MRTFTTMVSALALAGSIATPAFAQDDAEQTNEKWSVTITPRLQKLFFDAGGDGLENMNNVGASVSIRNPDQKFGISALYLQGTGKGDYDFSPTSNYRYKLKRREFALQGEFTPRETGVTFIAGFHNFNIKNNEFLTNPLPGNSEVNAYQYKISVAEVGVRLASRLGANSPHSLSAQFMGGIGRGRAKFNEVEVFNGFTNSFTLNDKGSGYYGEVALGYNVFLSRHISLGARARGYVFDIDVAGAKTVYALAPELNFSFRF